ncbi:E3 ubiquitin-protein ligase DMA2 [Penicillium macrosclerotiorum]|uniref:E3 ubiquitin-protein ligase DMA2 n=1 Tax=Penicillium macrosclerotiorum TaxID=303699 RepID=UPI002548E4E0|nr:E3 ubiquitin-protein ligase DMA2 [Penicillium macrosclerotiorum]KAJ5690080.1 E3 ubiquitin-protein ligase DMA2 [Penicillium macrosclerotiorum]
MSASTATASASLADSSRPGRLRRLSQLRAYTQNLSHSSPSSGQRSRTGLSSRVPWLSPSSPSGPESFPVESSTPPGPDSDQPALSRYTSAPTTSSHGLGVDTQTSSADSSRSTPPNELIQSQSHAPSQPANAMARLRSLSAVQGRPPRNLGRITTPDAPTSSPEPPSAGGDAPDVSGSTPVDAQSSSPPKPKQKATIRFFPYQETFQSSRPSLPFVPITRTLPSESCVIRVGRYSERDGIPIPNPVEPSDAPVGFKSKVVSRKHCEFMYTNGQWHIKDVGSSSGTFLNHMRLSQPNMVSRLYSIKDGDIVQLGIDFRGGEEMIFRCVRIRIECNRSWQQQPNEFNKNTESLIKNLGKGDTADYSGCRECSICLGSVLRPYQCLFMAACAHVWHYKCISRLLHSPDYPMFQCPNCRAFTDLSAEVDDTNDVDHEKGEKTPADGEADALNVSEGRPSEPQLETEETPPNGTGPQQVSASLGTHAEEPDLATDVENLHLQDDQQTGADLDDGRSSNSPAPNTSNDDLARSATINIPGWQPTQPLNVPSSRQSHLRADTPVRSETSDDNPLTPRNDSGPLAFDGRAGMP